jgi:hypothetical protein
MIQRRDHHEAKWVMMHDVMMHDGVFTAIITARSLCIDARLA